MVPSVPPMILNYFHVPNEIWYNENATSYRNCKIGEGEDKTCIDSHLDLSWKDHINLGVWGDCYCNTKPIGF